MARAVPRELLEEIAAALERDPHVDIHHWPISIWDEEGAVVLDGEVGDIAAKRAAVNAVQRLVQGRWPVLDMLRLAAEPTEDQALRDEVVNALSRESVFSNYDILAEVGERLELVHDAGRRSGILRVGIRDGVVTLSGRVGSLSHRRMAEVLTWWTAGCQRVVNQLEVFPPEEDNDNEVTDAVYMVLEKDPMVHAGQLRVGTAAGVVQLEGFVPSEEEKLLAVRDAWYVPGVWEVWDRIEVRH